MFCPQCGQEQISGETRFCSRCGFLLVGVSELIANGGAPPENLPVKKEKRKTPRKRGLKQGLFIFLLAFLFVPILAIITIAAEAEPFLVAMAAILFGVGGLLRAIYALMFESNEPTDETPKDSVFQKAQNVLGKKGNQTALPPQQTMPASTYVPPVAGNWRDTNDLKAPVSVTEDTTKLLELERKNEK